MITYFKNKNLHSKTKYENYKSRKTKLESADSIDNIGTTSISIVLSIIGIGLIFLPITAGIACTISLGNKVLHKILTKKSNKYKKQYGKYQQTIKFFDKLYRKSLGDNKISKNEYESHCNVLTNYSDETKNESFLKT